MSPVEMFAALCVGHALADYPLQGDFLARAKNRANPLAGTPWFQALGAHALIHAGFVGLVTGSLWIAAAEFFAHAAIDDLKCTGKIDFNADQVLHIVCKLIWVVIAFAGAP